MPVYHLARLAGPGVATIEAHDGLCHRLTGPTLPHRVNDQIGAALAGDVVVEVQRRVAQANAGGELTMAIPRAAARGISIRVIRVVRAFDS